MFCTLATSTRYQNPWTIKHTCQTITSIRMNGSFISRSNKIKHLKIELKLCHWTNLTINWYILPYLHNSKDCCCPLAPHIPISTYDYKVWQVATMHVKKLNVAITDPHLKQHSHTNKRAWGKKEWCKTKQNDACWSPKATMMVDDLLMKKGHRWLLWLLCESCNHRGQRWRKVN
jgi:hypothetical protein